MIFEASPINLGKSLTKTALIHVFEYLKGHKGHTYGVDTEG